MNPHSTRPTYLNYRQASGVPAGIRTGSPASSVSAPVLNRLPSTSASKPVLNRIPSASSSRSTTNRTKINNTNTNNNNNNTNNNSNSILIYVPSAASPTLPQHLSILLSTHRIAAVHLIGAHDVVLKNLRTELYTLAGRMRSDVQVSISLTEGAKALEQAVTNIGSRGQNVLGALVCDWDATAVAQHSAARDEQGQERDVLDMETDEVEAMWKASVLPLHALLRSLLPLFSSSTSSPSSSSSTKSDDQQKPQPFIYLDTPSTTLSPFTTTSRAALLTSLTSSSATKNILIGPASEHLVPAPPARAATSPLLPETQTMASLRIDTTSGGNNNNNNNNNSNNGLDGSTPDTSPLFGADNSPTKLWASWAAQYE